MASNFSKDFSEYRHNRGKRGEAPAFVCHVSNTIDETDEQTRDGILVPNIRATSLASTPLVFPDMLRGKVSLVVLGLRGISQARSLLLH